MRSDCPGSSLVATSTRSAAAISSPSRSTAALRRSKPWSRRSSAAVNSGIENATRSRQGRQAGLRRAGSASDLTADFSQLDRELRDTLAKRDVLGLQLLH